MKIFGWRLPSKEARSVLRIRAYIFALERLSEPSTLRGIAMIAMGASAAVNPDKLANIVMIGSVVVGMLGAMTPDAWIEKAKRKAHSLEVKADAIKEGM